MRQSCSDSAIQCWRPARSISVPLACNRKTLLRATVSWQNVVMELVCSLAQQENGSITSLQDRATGSVVYCQSDMGMSPCCYRKQRLLVCRRGSPKGVLDYSETCSDFVAQRFSLDLSLIGTSPHVGDFTVHRFYPFQRTANALNLLQNRR